MSIHKNRLRGVELQLCDVIRNMDMCARALVDKPTELEIVGVASVLVKLSDKIGVLVDEVKYIRKEGE